jgi:hypothetical protein
MPQSVQWGRKAPPGESNGQRQQFNNADSYHQHCKCYRIVLEPMPPRIYMIRHPVLRFTSVRAKFRAVFLFLHFELANECSEMPRHRSRKCVVLVLEALPNCQEPNASIASGIESGLALRRMDSVTVLNYMPTNPIINAVGCLSRGGDCRHGAPPCSCRAARSHPIKAPNARTASPRREC